MNFEKAANFIWENGRLLERRLSEYFFSAVRRTVYCRRSGRIRMRTAESDTPVYERRRVFSPASSRLVDIFIHRGAPRSYGFQELIRDLQHEPDSFLTIPKMVHRPDDIGVARGVANHHRSGRARISPNVVFCRHEHGKRPDVH